MKHFDTIINNMIATHDDPTTQYSPTQMFVSKNELSFAISRLMDAQRIFTDDIIDNKAITPELSALWFNIRDKMPSQTAKELAICIINNTPLSKTEQEISEVQDLFLQAMHAYTDNTELSNAFTEIFFGEAEAKMPKMRDRD